jgi:hypothetical protein
MWGFHDGSALAEGAVAEDVAQALTDSLDLGPVRRWTSSDSPSSVCRAVSWSSWVWSSVMRRPQIVSSRVPFSKAFR